MKNKSYFLKLKKKKKDQAEQQITGMFKKAEQVFSKSPKMADRNVRKARRLAMKHKIKMPKSLKMKFCKHCNSYLVPSVNCRIRLSSGKVVYYCLNCKKYMRFPYTKEKKEKLQLKSSEKQKDL